MKKKFNLSKIHHLIRYFVLLGIVIFIAYLKAWNDQVIMYLIGPPMRLAYFVKDFVTQNLPFVQSSGEINQYGYLLPICLIYFGMLGFFLKKLWNERGFMRFVSMFAMITFLIYVHYLSGSYLLGFLAL